MSPGRRIGSAGPRTAPPPSRSRGSRVFRPIRAGAGRHRGQGWSVLFSKRVGVRGRRRCQNGRTRRRGRPSMVAEGAEGVERSLMDVVTAGTPRTPGPDVDADDGDSPGEGRWARHIDSRRRRRRLRRRLAAVLAAAGIVAIVAGLSWHPGKHHAGTTGPQPVTVNGGAVTENTAKPPTTGPGG